MIDRHGRQINYLRLSVTDRCNLRCIYCMPPEGVPRLRHQDILTFEEIERVVKVGAMLGVTKVRLTGGEPLARKGIERLVQCLVATPGIEEVSMTTNGALLAAHAAPLRASGLSRLNISLDTLQPERYRRITRGGSIELVLEGIEAALSAGYDAVKINVVVMREINDDEIGAFARLTRDRQLDVSFIELMAVGRTGLADARRLVPGAEILERLHGLGRLDPLNTSPSSGPAQRFRLDGARGALGLITPVTSPFCHRCNRLRLSSEGKLRSCLLQGGEVELRALLRGSGTDEEIARAFGRAAALKPNRHRCSSLEQMSRIGG
ncbi:MAG: GTP 3',8-cyclase MoaA [Planctomycetes bacterium]|nr:GTP 3',8-cyclase MoaA [Planctomycetota bacterium]